MFIYESLVISIRKFDRTFQGFPRFILLPNSSRIQFFKNRGILLKKKAQSLIKILFLLQRKYKIKRIYLLI